MRLTFLFITSCLSISVYAKPMIVGKYMDPVDVPTSTCKVIIKNESTNLKSSCSSTLISPTKIVTANHCINSGEIGDPAIPEKMTNVTVICTDEKGEDHPSHIDPQEYKYSVLPLQDTVLAELELPITEIKSMPVATEAEIDEIMKDSTQFECAAIGYGHDNLGESGLKHGVAIHTPLTYEDNNSIAYYQDTDLHPAKTITQRGDSGGSLICKVNKEWKLVGEHKYISARGVSSIVSMEKLYEMRNLDQAQALIRIADYRNKKQNQIPLSQFANKTTRMNELYQAGYSLREIYDLNPSLKLMNKKIGVTFADLIQNGFDRTQVIHDLLPMYPKYINPKKADGSLKWFVTTTERFAFRDEAVPCSVIESGPSGLLAYNAGAVEIRDDLSNAGDLNRHYFSNRTAAEDYLMNKDPRCLSKKLKSFIEKNSITESELKLAGMSEHVIQLTRNLNPKTISGKKQPAQASPVPR